MIKKCILISCLNKGLVNKGLMKNFARFVDNFEVLLVVNIKNDIRLWSKE